MLILLWICFCRSEIYLSGQKDWAFAQAEVKIHVNVVMNQKLDYQ